MAEMKSRFQHLLVVECHTTDIKWYLHLLDSLGSFLDKNKSIYSNIISLLSCNWLLDDSLESSAVPFLVLPVWTSLYIFADQTRCLYFWKVQIIQQFITWLPGLWFIQRVLNYWVLNYHNRHNSGINKNFISIIILILPGSLRCHM